MKLLSIDKGNKQSLGVKTDTGIVDVERALSLYPAENVATTVMEVIENGPEGVMQLAEFMTHLPDQDRSNCHRSEWAGMGTRSSRTEQDHLYRSKLS